ncbi:mitochondrial tRNA-specific 2-thiouridylase 1, partial [Brachionus plicatilis]
ENDLEDAEYVCRKLDIPFKIVDFSRQYWNKVFSQFVLEYQQGLTPNPDILCNKFIKFPLLLDHCIANFDHIDYIATGHYSRLEYDNKIKKFRLLKGIDELKDQSFFLAQLEPSLLPRILFPVGQMFKSEVRKIAHDLGLDRVHRKKSSVGICFIGKRKFSDFIDEYIVQEPGTIVDLETSEIMGQHCGIHHFTIGQKIAINEIKNVKKKAYFVARKDFDKKIVYVVPGTDHPALYFDQFEIEKPHWLCENKELVADDVILNQDYEFKYQNKHYQSKIIYLRKKFLIESNQTKYFVKTLNHFRAVPKGQYAVFYNGQECIGSAKIINTPLSLYDKKYSGKIINSDKLLNKNYVSNKMNL